MRRYSKLILSLISCLLILFLVACEDDDPRNLASSATEHQEFLMGTLANIQVFNEDKDDAIEEAFQRVEELDSLLSMQKPESEIYAVNAASGIEAVEVSDEVFEVVELALEYAEKSNGVFDPTIGSISNLWGFGQEDASVPSPEEIAETLELVNYQNVELNEENQTIFLIEEGMMLDLGAIAKGYITDKATEVLVENGVDTAIINMGGDIFVLGNSNRGPEEFWNVGIQNPFADRGDILGILPLANQSIVTSGIYERLIESGDETYHHLLNPQTGYPFDNNIAGISLVADTVTEADVLATIAFGMGIEEGMEFVKELDVVEVLFVTRDYELIVSEAYEDEFELRDDEFEVIDWSDYLNE